MSSQNSQEASQVQQDPEPQVSGEESITPKDNELTECEQILKSIEENSLINDLLTNVQEQENDHKVILSQAIKWLEKCKSFLEESQLESPNGGDSAAFKSICRLMAYINGILNVLTTKQDPSNDETVAVSTASVWTEDSPCFNIGRNEDDESLLDDSDDDSLCNKLCTFTVTQKEFVNQHWYHCHTCNMIDRLGVCTICAKVCHKDHDISYARFGSFFCDCAVRENSTCMALAKRAQNLSLDETNSDSSSNANKSDNQASENKADLTRSSSTDTNSGRDVDGNSRKVNILHKRIIKILEPMKEDLLSLISSSNICSNTLRLLSMLITAYVRFAQNQSQIGRPRRTQAALDELDPFSVVKPPKRRKLMSKARRKSTSNGGTTFPVDFFETLQLMTDIDFGGSDLLAVYSVLQLKNRLSASEMHVACAKSGGFSVDVINNDSNMVVCGVRVQVGAYDIGKSPTSIEILGRTIAINPITARWYDLPLSRDESIRSDRRFTITFGPSPNPTGITTIDSIKVYGKTKESFAWPTDDEERNNQASLTGDDLIGLMLGQEHAPQFQTLIINSMECLENCLSIDRCLDLDKQELDRLARDLSTSLLVVPYPADVLKAIKSLLLSVFKDQQTYYQHRDLAALDFVVENLVSFRKQDHIDGETFTRVFLIMRSLCRSKTTNLTRLSECMTPEFIERNPILANQLSSDSLRIEHLIKYLHKLFQRFYSQKSSCSTSTSPAEHFNYEEILNPFIELIYMATYHDLSTLNVAIDVLIGFLLSEDLSISLSSRYILIRLMRVENGSQVDAAEKNAAQTNELDTIPEVPASAEGDLSQQPESLIQNASTTLERYDQPAEQLASQQSSIASQLRNVLREHIEVARHDNEDDIAIAIALSLQDDSQNNSVTDNAVTAAPTTSGRSDLNLLSDRMPSAEELMSDTTASGVASDEEVSSSAPRSITATKKSANSSLDCAQSALCSLETDSVIQSQDKPECSPKEPTKISDGAKSQELKRVRQQHLMLLEGLIEQLPKTRDAGGFRSISMLHVILVLTLDLDCENEVDEAILMNLLHTLREELLWNTNQPESIATRSSVNEVKLVIMRMFSILMSKVRTSSVASAVQSSIKAETNNCWTTFCSSMTASSLIESDVMEFCFSVLNQLLDYWRTTSDDSSNDNITSTVTRKVPHTRLKEWTKLGHFKIPDLSPFFQRQCVEDQATNLFDDYPHLLTEMVLRIPYQIKKVSSSSSNNLKSVTLATKWTTILCEYLMIPIPPYIKKHVRKLLTFICGSKEKYRQIRDFHFLESHMKQIRCSSGLTTTVQNMDDEYIDEIKTTSLNYKTMTSLVEHLRACIDIAQNRCINWQVFCLLRDQNLLSFLLRMSLNFGEDVSPIVLELLQHALSSSHLAQTANVTGLLSSPIITTAQAEVVDDNTIRDALTSESLSANLSQQLITSIPKELLSKFVQTFLLETNSTSIRWQAHNLLYNLWANFLPEQQNELLVVLWKSWNNLTKYGRKASQFVDLVGFITLKTPECGESYKRMFCSETLMVLRNQNQLLLNHPNAHIYSSIHGLVDLESYYLESEPCSVCNSPEVAYSNMKLSTIKVDSRFTTRTQIIKLIGTHTISKFSMRISDIKRSKMVKTISIYYNNRSVQAVVELKNKTGIWSLARKYPLSPGQTDVKIEFTLPIIACNLMIEFTDFYENLQASSETLQCPRCSTSVSANPGVCNNCGENVFQCHKCRSINYDERDPFLCISCGFCKYARFDTSILAKPTCAVDPIENEEDRKKTVSSIGNLLEKADRVYRSLMQNKPALEILLLRIHEQVVPDRHYDENMISQDNQSSPQSVGSLVNSVSGGVPARSIVVGHTPTSLTTMGPMAFSVNKANQHLAQKYCVECKSLFEELSKITHKILACRKELVEYDNRQLHRCLKSRSSVLTSANRRKSRVYSSLACGSGSCYGCATATVEHCVTMLKALSTIPEIRVQISESGIINELVNYNLRNGSYNLRQEIRLLICSLTRDDLESTANLTDMLIHKIQAISKQDYQPYEISHIVRHEIALLSVSLDSDDQCWELRLRCLFKIFALAFEPKNPTIMECLVIPCLRLLLSIVKPSSPTTRRHKDKPLEGIASVRSDEYRVRVLLKDWLPSSQFVFEDWRKRASKPANVNPNGKQLKPIWSILKQPLRDQNRKNYLAEKYGNMWRLKCSKFHHLYNPISTLPNDWLKRLLFNRSSKTVRFMTRSLIETLFSVESRRNEIVDLLTSYLDEIGPAGECAQEFFGLYRDIIIKDHWRYYLALRNVLIKMSDLIALEIDNLQELEESTLNSSLSLGHSLKMLLELFATFVSVPKIRSIYKSKLVGFALKGYLSLRKLVVQRTKVIDETQETLLELLESMTTGSESETSAFINVCVEAIRNCHESDIRTPVFIFERLCSTIHPEEDINSEFFVLLEKDPQQEDYLQGRMLNNPYSSSEPGMGPLMKDIKNKICQDCELLALLEDDSSMELLVSNKIICLDLPVRDVYKRIWCHENHDGDPMRIVYRMRGLLGDATEEFIESLDSRSNEEVDEEQVFKMANIMSSSGGLEVMIKRLKNIDDLSPPFKPLLDVLLKLFGHCTRTRANRVALMSPDLKAVETLLSTLKLAINEKDFLEFAGLKTDQSSSGSIIPTPIIVNKSSAPSARTQIVDQTLAILETILREASEEPMDIFLKFCTQACGTVEDIRCLLNSAKSLANRLPHVSHKIAQVLPFLTFGDQNRMATLVDFFKPSLDFEKFDQEHSVIIESVIDLFCVMVDAIEHNDNGNRLKDFIVSKDIVADCMRYLTDHSPPLKSSLLAVSDDWKEFTTRPVLRYVLRILGGLCQSHTSTQVLISRDCIPIVHGLEQVSSDAHVGTLAENLLEAIKQHPVVAEKIELVRRQTREEKKRLAMAVRERQLGALGMKANERGQVTAKSKLLEQCQDLAEDTGLICNICREGYKFQPTKVLGIYTYTKRCILDEFENKPRKTYGYTTVTHFNTVHIDCHMSAVRSARGRDEWDSAALQNANTRCNGLLPIWGSQVPESAYASALARHNNYLQDCTGHRDIGYQSTIHDIRLQLLRFAQERSFSEDTGGGGPQSNLHLLPYMIQNALYVLNSTRATTREYKRTLNHLDMMNSEEILWNCYEVESPYYWCVLALLVFSPTCWKKKRVQFLQRLILCNHVRRVNIKPPDPITDTRVRAYIYYKSALIFFAFIDSFYNIVFKDASCGDDKWGQDWSIKLADYLEHNDQTVNDNIEVLLNLYQNSILPCTSLERYFEIVRIDEVTNSSEFIVKTLKSA